MATPERTGEVLGDLEEAHRDRVRCHGRVLAAVLTGFEAVDMAVALLHERTDRRAATRGSAQSGIWTDGTRIVPTASWLDFKLGFRMLARYPSLTAVAVVAMAFGIAVGAGAFQLAKEMMLIPPLPYSEQARIVAIQNVSTRTTRPDPRLLHDFAAWHGALRSIDHLSVLSLRQRNLALGQGAAAPVAEAAVSATAFDLTRVAPLLGRGLLPADETPGAPPVVVIGYELWRTRFAADRDVVGTMVQLGGERTTVVGVMPRGFAFFVPREGLTLPDPQDLWVPFRVRARDYARGEGPAVTVFGRLARGATPERARSELATLAARAAAESPNTRDQLRPKLLTFEHRFGDVDGLVRPGALTLSALFLVALMVVVCGNVALLLFARAATRERELAVRSALGASRGRIVAQLFAEALVLAAVAIVVGLVGASAGLRWVIHVMQTMLQAQGQELPSWVGDTLSPTTIAYAVGLAVVGAVVAGVLPGLKVTGRRAHASLQRLAGSGAGVRLGGVWTAIIVTQVALTVMLVPIAGALGFQTWKVRTVDRNLPAGYLSVRLAMDGDAGAPPATRAPGATADATVLARFERSYRALERRLAAEPGVTGVTVASQLPGGWHDRWRFEMDTPGRLARARWESRAQIASVEPNFFEVMRTPIVSGRDFGAADAGAGHRVVIVNESFVREFLGGRNAVGHRVRYRDPAGPYGAGPWYTIVGVAGDLPMTFDPTMPSNAGIYQLLQPRAAVPLQMAVRVAGEPAAFTGRVHELAMETDPSLRIDRALPLDHSARATLLAYDAWFRVIVLAGAMAMLLTDAGIYAVISFTVARRTREIGVRVALGAERRQVITVILARTARHVAVGVLIGAGVGSLATLALSEGAFRPTALQGGGLLAAYVCVMMGVCLLGSVVPTLRALGVEPTVALAADG